MSSNESVSLEAYPAPVRAFFAAMDEHDADALVAQFPEDGLVNDIQREFWGPESIRRWVEKEITAVKVVAVRFTEAREHYGDVIVSAAMDGDYDKTNVPDPLILTHYFTLNGDKIVRLMIGRNKPGY